jgi:hypothetical protein
MRVRLPALQLPDRPCSIAVIGAAKSGKTTVCQSLLDATNMTLVCGSDRDYPHMPTAFVHSRLSCDLLEHIRQRQSALCRQREQAQATLVVDQGTIDDAVWRDLRQLLTNARTYRLSVLCALAPLELLRQYDQDPNDWPDWPAFDYVICCAAAPEDKQAIWQCYLPAMPWEAFSAIFDQTTAAFGCLVIDLSSCNANVLSRLA